MSPTDPITELRYALAQADAAVPPAGLRTRVLAAAQAARVSGRPLDQPPAIGSVEAYRRTVQAFHTLLLELRDDEWDRRVLRDLDIQGLVGHLIGVERHLQVTLGIEGPATDISDHVAGTQPDAEAQRGRDPDDTRRDWLAGALRTLGYLESADPAVLHETITLHGYTLPVAGMLIVRSFETWIHEEDIRRATGRPLVAPDPSRLTLMTNLAVGGIPRALTMAGRTRPGYTARLVLTGPGGGTWLTALDYGGGAGPAPGVRIVVDATSFCRLVANRLDPDEVAATITGDHSLGRDLLVGAMALALD